MTHAAIRAWLRQLYNYHFGPGYFPPRADGKSWEDIYLYVAAIDPENGLANVYVDFMAHRGGDAAIVARLQGRFGTFINA